MTKRTFNKVVGAQIETVQDGFPKTIFLDNGYEIRCFDFKVFKSRHARAASSKDKSLQQYLRSKKIHWYTDRRKDHTRIKICTGDKSVFNFIKGVAARNARLVNTIEREDLKPKFFMRNPVRIILRVKHGISPKNIPL